MSLLYLPSATDHPHSPYLPGSLRPAPALLPGQPVSASGMGYTPFGTPQSGAAPQPFGFTGEMQSAATGLVYLRARWYDPAGVVRFLTDYQAVQQAESAT